MKKIIFLLTLLFGSANACEVHDSKCNKNAFDKIETQTQKQYNQFYSKKDKKLIQAQKSFADYRDKMCNAISYQSTIDLDTQSPSSKDIWESIYYQCMIEITQENINRLKKYIKQISIKRGKT